MIESLRIYGILLRKSWLVRKRHRMAGLVGEIFLPLFLVVCAWLFLRQDPNPPKFIETDSTYKIISSDQLIDEMFNDDMNIRVLYTPVNSFTDKLMMKVDECLKNKANITGFDTETELITFYLNQTIIVKTIAIIFDEATDWSTKHLRYKLRRDNANVTQLYSSVLSSEISSYYRNWITLITTQICLDESFVKTKINTTFHDIPQFSIQQMPYPAHFEEAQDNPAAAFPQLYKTCYTILLVVAFQIPLFIEISRVTNEKFVGMNVLISMNGISNALNLLSWIISGMILLSILCIISTLLIYTSDRGNGSTFMYYGNPFVVFFVLLFHVAHMITFGIHITAYFSKGLFVTFSLMIMNILVMALRICALEGDYLYLVPYLGIIFPNVLLYQAMREISSNESLGVQWSNLFRNAHLPCSIENSIGMILILSIAGAILHFVLAIYVYTLNPGKYGIGKNPFMSIVYRRKKGNSNSVVNLMNQDIDDQYFEPIPTGIYVPGIQIRNLKKSYSINIFSKKKVEALRGVSVDFYKGQITTLLGHNGAGKSTLMSILTGLTRPTDGIVLINSKNLKDNASEILKDMGLCTQDDMYFSCLTVTEQLEFLSSVKQKCKSKLVIREEVQVLVQKLKLFHVKDTLANALSEDQKRKLCLGMAFVGEPSILVLDEPTSRLDHESKRVIWDILLEMRGQKTILISTHDMEEADILGDRIAIMQKGRLISYGTSLYLKKMIAGQNNIEVRLSMEKWADPDSVLSQLHVNGKIIRKQDKTIILSLPNVQKSSEHLEKLKQMKKDLGISEYNFSLTSLEQVFLKITRENDNPLERYVITIGDEEKLNGIALTIHRIHALLAKKMSSFLQNSSIILIQFLTAFIAFLTILISRRPTAFNNEPLITINPNIYKDAYIIYSSFDGITGNQFKRVCQNREGNSIEIRDKSLDKDLLRRAKENLMDYNNYLIAGAGFEDTSNGSTVNAFYSARATFSLPISINLLWNTIFANILGEDHSISMISQDLPREQISDLHIIIQKQHTIATPIFVILLNFLVAMFAIHPRRESSRGIKHLQTMTGISGFVYWGTTFISDLIMYIIIVLSMISGLLCLDYLLDLRLYRADEIMILLLLLILFAMNALPIVYMFSFVKMKTQMVVRLLTFVPMGIVILKSMLSICKAAFNMDEKLYFFQMKIFLVLPYVSVLEGMYDFTDTAILNSMCRRLRLNSYIADCINSNHICCIEQMKSGRKPYFSDKAFDINLKLSVIYLCATPLIYFGILALLEARIFQRIQTRCIKLDALRSSPNEEVQREKSMILENIQILNKNKSNRSVNKQRGKTSTNQIFLAYELGKNYGKVRAVEDVNFGVTKGECFGLFGVNGSGKSVTLQMISGREILNHGEMYIEDKDFKSNERYFLSQIGYCPQRNATLKCLNSYDHLQLFARLRGIPEKYVDKEVEIWIDRMNLNSCATLPSGTYSVGNKQRLNIAIALIGNPKLILLDEPTVGVDPGAKHLFWNTIKSCQLAGQTFLLASHNMDECEALCERTAVMLDGKLICIGSPRELKQRFGAGYDVQIRIDSRKSSNQVDRIKKDMRLLLHCVLTNENSGYLMYHVVGAGTTWKKIYGVMDKIKSKYDCIDDYLVVVRPIA